MSKNATLIADAEPQAVERVRKQGYGPAAWAGWHDSRFAALAGDSLSESQRIAAPNATRTRS